MAWILHQELQYALAGIPGANLSDFDKLFVIVADADIAAELASGGGVKVTSPDGMTDLSFGLLAGTNLAAGTLYLRVNLDPLTAATVGDVMAVLWFSASESTVEDKAGTVPDHDLYMPCDQDPSGSAPQVLDWKTETYLGTSGGSMTSGDLVAGQVGQALEFDGSNDRITVPSNAAYSDTIGTWEALFRTDGTWGTAGGSGGGGQGTTGILTRHSTGTDSSGGITLGVTTSGVFFQCKDTSNNIRGQIAQAATVTDDEWHAFGLTYNGTSGQPNRVYIDGVEIASVNSSGNWSFGAYVFTIGNTISSWWEAFAGGIQHVRIAAGVTRSAEYFAYRYVDDFDNASTFTRSATLGGASPVTVDVSPVSCSLSVVQPTLSLTAAATPQSVVCSPLAPSLALTCASSPLSVACSAVAPSLTLTCGVSPLSITCSPAAPTLSITVHPSPRVITCTVAAPSLPSVSFAVRTIYCEAACVFDGVAAVGFFAGGAEAVGLFDGVDAAEVQPA